MLGLIVFQVQAYGAVPVDLVVAWTIGTGCSVEATSYGLEQWVGQFPFQFFNNFAYYLACSILCLLRNNFAEGEQGGDEVYIGFYLFQHLRLKEHLLEIETFKGILLHDAYR